MLDHAVSADVAAFSESDRLRSRRLSTHLLVAGLIGDTLAIFLGLAFSSWLRFETVLVHYGRNAASVSWQDYLGHVAIGTVLFIVLLPHRTLYDRHALLQARIALRAILAASVRWVLAFTAFSWFIRPDAVDVSRAFVVIAFVITTGSLLSWRWCLHRVVVRTSLAAKLRQNILFVGWSPPAAAFAGSILGNSRSAHTIVGFVTGRAGSPEVAPGPEPVRCIGELSQVADLICERDIDVVVLADPDLGAEDTLALANLCEKELVEFKVIPSCFQILLSCLRLQTLGRVPVLGIDRLPLESPAWVLLKRIVDILGGAIGLIVSAPVIVGFGLLVYLEDPGPIIYRQRRLGEFGRPFWIYKVRSMRVDAERHGVGWTVRNDPRRLRIGSFMRRWNIDELPQFWNVLRGDMSLVGPRPERPELIREFKDRIPHYNARHGVKPGLTGWAQINGMRGDTDLNERVRCDLYYMENWSPLLDFQIILLTFVRHKNAG